jgi:hypothetical protein
MVPSTDQDDDSEEFQPELGQGMVRHHHPALSHIIKHELHRIDLNDPLTTPIIRQQIFYENAKDHLLDHSARTKERVLKM